MTWWRRMGWLVAGTLLVWSTDSLSYQAGYVVGFFSIPTLALGWVILYGDARLWRRILFLIVLIWTIKSMPPFQLL